MAENESENIIEDATEQPPQQETPEPEKLKDPSNEPKYGYWWGTGSRKSPVARVRIRPGDGKIIVNKKQLDDYFPRVQDQRSVVAPLKTVDAQKMFDIFINVRGGGSTGQSGAASLGIARALKIYNEQYLPALRTGGHLTRDSRMVERKKYGQKGARKRFQFSKR